MGDDGVGSGAGDGTIDGGIVDFLCVVRLAPPRVASGMIVREVRVVGLDGADEVPFHDLHVVDVIEELEGGGVDPIAEAQAPGGGVAFVALVVDLAVQEFHGEGDPRRFPRRG